jgi:hypothetical protein
MLQNIVQQGFSKEDNKIQLKSEVTIEIDLHDFNFSTNI